MKIPQQNTLLFSRDLESNVVALSVACTMSSSHNQIMDYAKFQALIAADKEKHAETWRVCEELKMIEPPASDDDIAEVEAALKAKLPAEYVAFLKDYGGGVVSCNSVIWEIYSANRESENCILRFQLPPHLIQNFVAFAEDGWGNYYGFAVEDGQCQSRVLFCDHEMGFELRPTRWDSILSFIAAEGFE